MKNKKIKDERIVQLTNKIFGEAFLVVVFGLIVSVMVKAYLFNLPVTEYASELIIVALSILYVAVRSMIKGNTLIDASKRGKLLSGILILLLSIGVTVLNGIKNYASYKELYTGIFDMHFLMVLLVSFISSTIFISLAFFLIYVLHKKGQQKIEKEIDEEENQ